MTPPSLTKSIRNWLSGHPGRPEIPDQCAAFLRNHRVLGLLYHIDANLSESLQAEARSNWEKNAHGYLKRVSSLKTTWPLGVHPPLLIKGADYNEILYNDPGARVAYDLDCLVHSSATQHVLEATHPWQRSVSTRDVDGLGIHWEAMIDGVLIEFHSMPGPNPPWSINLATVWKQAHPITLDGFVCTVPSPMDRLGVYLINQAKSAFTDGFWALVDLALILRHIRADGINWSQIEDYISELGLERAYALAVHRLREAKLTTDLPEVGHDPFSTFLVQLIPKNTPTHLGSPLRRHLLRMCLCPARRRTQYMSATLQRIWTQWTKWGR